MNLIGKTAFITGATRGIGLAIALRLAHHGANIVVIGKSVKEDPRLGGTIYTAAEQITQAGGRGLAIQCDIRDEEQIISAVQQTIALFGGIDFLINNASAISLTPTEHTDAKRFDLMHNINVRGTFLVTKYCLPFLKKSSHAHILTLSPPLNMAPNWLAPHIAYTIAKYNMSLLTLGWAAEFAPHGIAANALWPATTIATAAVRNLLGGQQMAAHSRTPAIVADAAYHILTQAPRTYTGQLLIDEEVLRSAGITNFDHYAVTPGLPLQPDLYI